MPGLTGYVVRAPEMGGLFLWKKWGIDGIFKFFTYICNVLLPIFG